jgi:UPF0716 protein FxsA
MRYLVLICAAAFPLLDFYLTLRFAAWSGVPAWAWFGAGLLAGFALLSSELNAFRSRTLAALSGDQPLVRAMLDSGRRVLAGVLFLLPGLASDVIALLLLLLPINLTPRLHPQAVTNHRPGLYDGDYRRID